MKRSHIAMCRSAPNTTTPMVWWDSGYWGMTTIMLWKRATWFFFFNFLLLSKYDFQTSPFTFLLTYFHLITTYFILLWKVKSYSLLRNTPSKRLCETIFYQLSPHSQIIQNRLVSLSNFNRFNDEWKTNKSRVLVVINLFQGIFGKNTRNNI